MQGFVFRPGDARFAGKTAQDALAAALADPSCLMVSRNAGAGTRILIDRLLAGRRPPGYANQPKSHNAVAAAVAQGRADWGIAIATRGEALRAWTSCRSRRSIMIFSSSRATATARRCRPSSPPSRTRRCASASRRSA